jgi:hypothetical protein
VLALDEGDVWVGQSLQSGTSPADKIDSQSIDSAMQNVAEDLSVISKAADEVAEKASLEGGLHVNAIDQAMTGEIS